MIVFRRKKKNSQNAPVIMLLDEAISNLADATTKLKLTQHRLVAVKTQIDKEIGGAGESNRGSSGHIDAP